MTISKKQLQNIIIPKQFETESRNRGKWNRNHAITEPAEVPKTERDVIRDRFKATIGQLGYSINVCHLL